MPTLSAGAATRSLQFSIRFWGMAQVDSGVGSAIDSQIRTGNIRGLRTGYERNQRGDFVHGAIAVERSVRLLWRCPITRGGIEIGVDRSRLNIIDRDAAAANFSGQPLSKHLDGALGGRVGGEARSHHALADAGADIDDATAIVHVL